MTHTVHPSLTVNFGDDVYFEGRVIGYVSGLSMDADNCYVTTTIRDKAFTSIGGDFTYSTDARGRVFITPTQIDAMPERSDYSWTGNVRKIGEYVPKMP